MTFCQSWWHEHKWHASPKSSVFLANACVYDMVRKKTPAWDGWQNLWLRHDKSLQKPWNLMFFQIYDISDFHTAIIVVNNACQCYQNPMFKLGYCLTKWYNMWLNSITATSPIKSTHQIESFIGLLCASALPRGPLLWKQPRPSARAGQTWMTW